MKLTFITNACCLYEHDGFKLLCDPWLVPGAFGSWVHDPPLKTRPEDVTGVDALYISHIHPDHLCEATLAHFDRRIPIVYYKDKYGFCPKKLRELGFKNLIGIEDGHYVFLGPFRCVMYGPFTKHPHHDAEIGNIVDSALLIEAGGQRVLNTNDNTPSRDSAWWLRSLELDVVQLNYNNAGPYPACFDNLTPEEKLAEASRCVERNLNHMLEVAKAVGAKKTMPFAGAYILGYGLEDLNSFLGTTTAMYASDYLEQFGMSALYLEEGDSYDLGTGEITRGAL